MPGHDRSGHRFVESAAEGIQEAIASTHLDGLELSDEFLADAALVAAGAMDGYELLARTLARHSGAVDE